jgi:hypothetical protein
MQEWQFLPWKNAAFAAVYKLQDGGISFCGNYLS